jgi:hypothetical protein
VTTIEGVGGGDIYVVDDLLGPQPLARRVTFAAADETNPVWRTDTEIVFGLRVPSQSVMGVRAIALGGNLRLHRLSADAGASRPPEPIRPLDPDRQEGQPTFTADGRYAVVAEGDDLWRVSLDDPQDVVPIIETPGISELEPALSPNGQWLAYTSIENQREDIYLRPFPPGDARGRPVSPDGGRRAVWAPDGRALFYRADTAVLRVPITTGRDGLIVGRVEPYLSGLDLSAGGDFDVAPDGRLLIARPYVDASDAQTARQIVIVENWLEELKRLVPTR